MGVSSFTNRCVVVLWPVLIAIVASILLRSRTAVQEDHTTREFVFRDSNEKIYVIVSKPDNELTKAAIRHLQPSFVYIAYPPQESSQILAVEAELGHDITSRLKWCPFDPMGGPSDVNNSAATCLRLLSEDLVISCQTTPSESLDLCDSRQDSKIFISGVLFNPYGAVGDDKPSHDSGLLPLAEYKLIGNAIFLHNMLDSDRFFRSNSTRIIFSGSESARGLPKMGFPAPTLGRTQESIASFMTGTAYDAESSPYTWERAYANLCAIMVLYVRSLSRIYPQFYFGVVSPGMTDESLKAKYSPNPSLLWRIQLLFFRKVMFPLLCRWEIAKTADEGARLLIDAVTGVATRKGEATEEATTWNYASGSFVGARSGTGGPICDQTLLEGGKIYLDEGLQNLTFESVSRFVVQVS